jgi:Na+-transporting methylmalonyl-CoA/oxaloacetate decarboxylase gamma subunit
MNDPGPGGVRIRWGCLAIAALGTVAFVMIFASFVVGGVMGARGAYHNRFLREERVARTIIEGCQEFAEVEVEEASEGYAILAGTVPDKNARSELAARMKSEFGEHLLKERLSAVDVRANGEDARPRPRSGHL